MPPKLATMRPRHPMSRRAFFKCTGAAAVTAGSAYAWGYGVEVHNLVIEHVHLPLPGLAARWAGKRLVQLSDLHVNGADSPALVNRAFDMAVDCDPEFIVVTGDWVNDSIQHFSDIQNALARVPEHIGVVGIFGNHDYCYKKNQKPIDHQLAGLLTNQGVRLLRNQLWQPYSGPGELCFAGLDDYWCQRTDPRILLQAPKTGPLLVLSHNPDSFDVMAPYRWDAVLCGHTHGGQVRIPGIGALKVPVAHTEWSEGLYHPAGDQRIMYVNRGVGHWFRIRLFCPPEVTCITLARA